MAISADLLAIMQCPSCGGSLTEMEEPHRLVCSACGLAYPIREGIPVMLIEEAKPDA